MRLVSGTAGILATASLGACSGYPAGWSELVYVGDDRIPHETFTWYGPIGEAYQPEDERIGRVAPGRICEMRRIVDKPEYDEIRTESGELMDRGAYQRTLFSECIEPGKEIQ